VAAAAPPPSHRRTGLLPVLGTRIVSDRPTADGAASKVSTVQHRRRIALGGLRTFFAI
jgi:hypothetical protein